MLAVCVSFCHLYRNRGAVIGSLTLKNNQYYRESIYVLSIEICWVNLNTNGESRLAKNNKKSEPIDSILDICTKYEFDEFFCVFVYTTQHMCHLMIIIDSNVQCTHADRSVSYNPENIFTIHVKHA